MNVGSSLPRLGLYPELGTVTTTTALHLQSDNELVSMANGNIQLALTILTRTSGLRPQDNIHTGCAFDTFRTRPALFSPLTAAVRSA